MLGSPIATVLTEAQISANNKLTGKMNKASNKANETLSRRLNKQKGLQKDAFVTSAGVVATVGAAAGVAKSTTVQKVLSESFKPIKDAFSNSNFGKDLINGCKNLADEAKPFLEQGAKWVKNLPKPAKAILGIGAGLTALASTIVQAQTRKNDTEIAKEYAKKEALIEQQHK